MTTNTPTRFTCSITECDSVRDMDMSSIDPTATATHLPQVLDETFIASVRKIRSSPWPQAMLQAVAGPAFVLDSERHVVAASSRFVKLFGASDSNELLGLRSGDAMGCRLALRHTATNKDAEPPLDAPFAT